MTPKKKAAKKTKQKSRKASAKRTATPRKKGIRAKKGSKRPSRRGANRRSQRASSTQDRKLIQAPPSPDDLGLSDRASADSESVDELLDEGNAFEAGAVSGVERADNSEGKEVRTKEVPEDDVPEEYLDNER